MKLQAFLALLTAIFLAGLTAASPADGSTAVDNVFAIEPSLGSDTKFSSIIGLYGEILDPPEQVPIKLPPTVILTMGTQRQHSRDLRTELYRVLHDQCWNGGWTRIPGGLCRRDTRRINKIEYNSGNNAWLDVKVESDYIVEADSSMHDDRALLNMFIDQIVSAFDAAINTPQNRYQIEVKRHGAHDCIEFANSADWYQVSIANHDGPTPHMRVSIRFNGKTLEGTFDCIGSQTPVWGTLPDWKVQQYASALNEPMAAAVSCDGTGAPTGDCKVSSKDGVCLPGNNCFK